MTRCGGAPRAPSSWGRTRRAPSCSACSSVSAGSTAGRSPNWPSGEKYAAEALSDGERQHLDAADLAGAPAHVAGDYPEWLGRFRSRLRRDARARGRSARLARAAQPAGEHTEGRPRQSGRHAVGPEAGTRGLVAFGGCAFICRPTPRARRSMPSRRSSRGSSKCRTKVRNWPRCFPALRPASRRSISAPAPAARHSRSPP